MSDAASENEPVVPGAVKMCKACGVRPAGSGRFGHYCDDEECKAERLGKEREERPTKQAAPRRRGPSTSLEREIKEAMMGTAAIVSISNPGVFVAVEQTVDEFAASWANVARQSPSAERYIRAMLSGGVWMAAASSTLVMVVAVMVTTGSCPPRLVPLGWWVIGSHPRIGEFVNMKAQEQAAQPEQETEPDGLS